MTKEKLEALTLSLQKIEILAQSMKMTLTIQDRLTAEDWLRIGYMGGQLSRCVDNLTVDLIGLSHDLYNPIPGKKLS